MLGWLRRTERVAETPRNQMRRRLLAFKALLREYAGDESMHEVQHEAYSLFREVSHFFEVFQEPDAAMNIVDEDALWREWEAAEAQVLAPVERSGRAYAEARAREREFFAAHRAGAGFHFAAPAVSIARNEAGVALNGAIRAARTHLAELFERVVAHEDEVAHRQQRPWREAAAMGLHARLGALSGLHGLPPELVEEHILGRSRA